MTYTLKPGVLLFITPEIDRMLNQLADPIFAGQGVTLHITSGMDGEHHPPSGRTSLHYHAKAFDTGIQGFTPDIAKRLLQVCRAQVTKRRWPVQIVPETDHWHWEWDAP